MFLDYFGLWRELDELRRRVEKASTHVGEVMTRSEYLRQSGLGEDEYRKGDLQAAYTRFMELLARIGGLPEGTPLGRGSYEHCLTLNRVALCLRGSKLLTAAEVRLREALAIIEVLARRQPEDQAFTRQQGIQLADLGITMFDQGQYLQAQQLYEKALEVFKRQGDLRSQAIVLDRLGMLTLYQENYAQARSYYNEALKIDQDLGELSLQAVVWHQLGMVADRQQDWADAEHCYRESLTIKEQLGDVAGASKTCNHLGIVASLAGRPSEAEGWWKRTLELDERVHPGSDLHAGHLSNLARLLMDKVLANRTPATHLTEARGYAERALAIRETPDASSEIWYTLSILADIANLEGRTEEARDYRRRERETYAAFAGNRYHIDRQHGQLIADIAAAAKGDVQARAKVEAALPQFEEHGWHITAAIQRIWAGERDWDSLVEDFDGSDALLVLRVLETIAQPTEAEVIASLPEVIRKALERGNEAAFNQALEALSPEEQKAVVEAIRYLQAQHEEGTGQPDVAESVQQFEPLLQAIAVVAKGDAMKKSEIEEVLADLETKGWHLKNAVQRIWAGERDETALTADLDEQDSALVYRVLEIIAAK